LDARAAAVSVARVIASRLAQASAATSAAWRRFVKCFPQIPGELFRPRVWTRSPYETDFTYDLGGKAVSKRHHPARSMALRRTPGSDASGLGPLRRRTRAGSGYLADGRRNGHCSARAQGIRRKSTTSNNVG
jgi:hypothetical protein